MHYGLSTGKKENFFFFFFVLDREIIRYVLWTSDMVYYFIKKNLNV